MLEACEEGRVGKLEARQPFGKEELEYIRSTNGPCDATSIEHQVGVRLGSTAFR